MDVSMLSVTDRTILQQAFQQYRATDEYEVDNTTTRDALVAKLQDGAGRLDETDRQMLGVSVAIMTDDDDLLKHFTTLLGL